MILIEIFFRHLKWRILAARTLRLGSRRVQRHSVTYAPRIFASAATTAVKPKQQAEKEECHHDQKKDDYTSQNIIHGKTSLLRAPCSHALTRLIGQFPHCRDQ